MVLEKVPPRFSLSAPGAAALVAVGTEWCGFCKRAKPVLEDVKKAVGTMVNIYWLDADQQPKKAQSWGVDGYPTIFYKTKDGRAYRYDGQVTFDGLSNFMCTLSPNVCTRVPNK